MLSKRHMADNYQRDIVLDDALLLARVTKKGGRVEEGDSVSRQAEELAKQHETVLEKLTAHAEQVNNLNLNVMPRTEKLAKKQLTEFDIPVTTVLQDGKVVLQVTEALEEFKGSFKSFDKWHQPVPRRKKEPLADNQ